MENRMFWEILLPDCFDDRGVKFAARQADETLAIAAIGAAKTEGATRQQFEDVAVAYAEERVPAQGRQLEVVGDTIDRLRELWPAA
jgi:hypothetical protein